MKNHGHRTYPIPRTSISTLKDLDNFFDNMVGIRYPVAENPELPIPAAININEVYCYVSLEFVQQYHLKHLMGDPLSGNRVYSFGELPGVPGVYQVTACIRS